MFKQKKLAYIQLIIFFKYFLKLNKAIYINIAIKFKNTNYQFMYIYIYLSIIYLTI